MEFDKSKILTVVTAGQAIACKKGWFSNDIPSLKIYIERGDEPKGLQGVDVHNEYPFRESYPSDGSFACKYRYFYPAQEPIYEERQAQWVKANGVKSGTRVRVTRTFTKNEAGSCCLEHNDLVGKTGVVVDIIYNYLDIYTNDGYMRAVPYFALEVIKEPTYRPYNNDELNELVGEVLTNKQSGRRKLVTGKPTESEGVNLDKKYITAKDLLASFYRNGNEPCGVRVEW